MAGLPLGHRWAFTGDISAQMLKDAGAGAQTLADVQ
jgi:triosephosphate isomerase